MKVQVFVQPVSQHEELTAAMNAWLAEHPGISIEKDAVHIYHNHTTNGDDVLVMLFYAEKAARKTRGQGPGARS